MLTENLARLARGAPASRLYRLSMDGLFGTARMQYGNNKPKSLHKTRRAWLPNIQKVSLFSALLGKKLDVNVTTRVLRTIDKKGGLDSYLLLTKDKNINSEFGLRLKQQLLGAQKKQKCLE
ncbi:hypothetical protein IWW55_004302 [Coemansia sp. RSA 2706]|nr:hypothetical protein LPJ63_004188 [Coemansia sp. RSA 2711]KAJ1848183.1 hypothetical protein LPJ70_001152 [Coemansia sp. RSA 2708]KAJ2299026.1 hypothetical protein IWW55_004302 [Coemansia sp. RSA 2706]KAJ2309503.1 hypothetical protein IWW54_003696 [Coemansia sp. RSA 2705]KAJ2311521.1 hypothetical protein IWW52_005110 [Coemansia sp. RSA 2704]KAJ2323368.1 hypothetical protein IWW51_003788 [Coemansia sp. RSA 2702]KAJ2362888.1 hypothetical protein H4S01_004573 [Coemansia sp. RSA 2610]KAJ238217